MLKHTVRKVNLFMEFSVFDMETALRRLINDNKSCNSASYEWLNSAGEAVFSKGHEEDVVIKNVFDCSH